MTAQVISSQLTQWLFGMLSPTPGASKGGALGSVAGFFGSLFGGKRATGGRTQGGRAYLVGENGPEIWAEGENGYITPNHHLQGGAGGQGGGGNMRVIASFNPREILNILASSEGERVYMAHFQRNAGSHKEFLARA
jgi:hypothetical protein